MIEVRASSLGTALDCAARWKAEQLLKLRLPSTGKAALGRAIHKSTAVYDQSTLDHAGITIHDAAGAAVDLIHKPDDEVVWEDDLSPKDAEGIAVALHTKYCETIAPTQNYAAVEAECERLEITDLGIALKGTTDRVVRGTAHWQQLGSDEKFTTEAFGIVDLKSGKTAVRADGTVEVKGHAAQIGMYELLAERATGLSVTEPARVIGLQTGKTDKAQRVAVSALIHGARDLLVGDADSPGVLEVLARMIQSDTFPGNPRSMMCNPKYCAVYESCRWRK